MKVEKYRMAKWSEGDYFPIQQLIEELQSERRGRVYNNRAILEAVEFYRKYRKLVEGKL